MNAELEALVAAVRAGAAYRAITPSLVRTIAEKESRAQPSRQAALKATRSKLHQVAGAYLDRKIDFAAAISELHACGAAGDADALRACCARLLACHASTRERLPFLESFYDAIFRRVGSVRRILDLGCGMNPLAIPWMALPTGCVYQAIDVYEDLMPFLDAALPLLGVTGQAAVASALDHPITAPVDLALLLKCLPCFEQIDRAAVPRLLDSLQARHILLTYPVRSLSGRAKGMAVNYEAQFQRLAAGRDWQVERLLFPNELAFLVRTNMAA